jgi:predicted TIM-barrel fold metal-dependent hydrolase
MVADAPLLIISSDGHLSPRMAEYRPYIDVNYREDFEQFLLMFNEYGTRSGDLRNMEQRTDREVVDEWREKMLDSGRWEDFHDPDLRLKEAEQEGVAAEVVFPDFGGMPFEYGGVAGDMLRAESGVNQALPAGSEDHFAAGMRAYNRWLVDFVSNAPERFFGQAAISWQGKIEDVIAEIRWARNAGLRGVILPKFSADRPLFHPDFEPIWNTLDELEMVVNSHIGASSTQNDISPSRGAPHPALLVRITMPEHVFYTRNVLSHLVWGGVLERHPELKFVFSEMGSAWVVSELQGMDFTYHGSYFRSDYHDIIRRPPSEYFIRQCYLGSSTFARVEIESRHEIGINHMMLGMDMPHHEGTLIETTREYLKATLGAECVPIDEARLMLGQTAAGVFGFDVDRLSAVVDRIGLRPEEILVAPESDLYPRGDVHRPATARGTT